MFNEGAVHELSEPLFYLPGKIPVPNYVITMWAIMFLLFLLSWLATKNMKKVPTGVQNVMEYAIEGLLDFFSGVMGRAGARAYIPLLGTFFLFILFSNYSGLIPGMNMLPGMKTPTADVSVTAALAIITFFSVFILGIKKKGLRFFAHFITPYVLLLPLNLIEEIVRPISLTLRLYGNVFGEEKIIEKLGELFPLLPLPMMFLALLTGAIQAFVFTLLSSTYIASATEDHH